MKNFPRIHSLGTVNIIHHQEFFYEFHPFRTDFVGESGVGKSIVTDLLQLIIVGSSLYESSTQSQGDRPFQKLVLNTGTSPDFAYAFINVEIERDQFIALGTYIEKTARQSEAFIIQKGLDFEAETLRYLDQPITIEDFEVNGDWLPIVDLETYFTVSKSIGFKKFRRFTEYHLLLSRENLIPLDITTNNEMAGYAKILQAFSRKGINVKSSIELQKFLFGTFEQQKYLKQYNEIVQDLQDNQNDYKINLTEIDKINKQKDELKKLYELKLLKEASEKKYYKRKWKFLYYREKILKKELLITLSTYLTARQSIKKLNRIAEKKLKSAKQEAQGLESSIAFAKSALKPYRAKISEMKLVDDFLGKHDTLKAKDILDYQTDFKTKKDLIERIARLQVKFKSNNLEQEFSKLAFDSGLTAVISHINKGIETLRNSLEEIETLRKFNDYQNTNSLAYWIVQNNKNLSLEEESIIKHFQDVGTQKPKEVSSGKQYIPNPEELLQSAKNTEEEATANGFWISLKGLRIFISNVEKQIFKNKERQGLINIFKEAEIDVLARKTEIKQKHKFQNELLNFINDLDEPKLYFEAWQRRDEISYDASDIEDPLLLKSEEEVKNIIALYKDKVAIEKKFTKLEKEYDVYTIKQALLEGLEKDLKGYKYIKLAEPSEDIAKLLTQYKIDSSLDKKYDFEPSSFYKEFSDEYQKNKDVFVKDEQIMNVVTSRELNDKEISQLKLKFDFKKPKKLVPITQDDLTVFEEALEQSWEDYKIEFSSIVKNEIKNDADKFYENYEFKLLAKTILPRIFKDISFEDKEVIDKITQYLEDIFDRNAELDKNKLSRIKDLIRDVQRAVKSQSNTARRIKNIFNKDDKIITGGNKAVLKHEPNERISIDWLNDYLANLANSEVSLFNETGEYPADAKQKKYVSIGEKIKRAYSKHSKLPLNAVDIEDLLNPFSYYSLSFKIETPNKAEISGSTGQTYTATALLCIAKLSLIQEDAISKPGLRFMTIDETEGIGSNFDMLRKVAKKFDYQILSLSIGLVKLTEGNQHIFELFKNPDLDFINHHPVGILSN